MRSPWLSRKYEKLKTIEIKKEEKGYLLINKKSNRKLFLTK